MSACLSRYFLDKYSLIAIHVILFMFLLFSIINAIIEKVRENINKRKPGIHLSAEVIRGEQSMNAIYVMYGIATIAVTLAVDVSEEAKGSKTSIVIIDYAILSYLFFFNPWFKNKLIGIFGRMKKD